MEIGPVIRIPEAGDYGPEDKMAKFQMAGSMRRTMRKQEMDSVGCVT